MSSDAAKTKPQLLHLVFGGELTRLDGTEFKDLSAIHFVGVFPDFASAQSAWRAAAQASVDNAMIRYFIVHLHRYLDPDSAVQHDLAGTR
ncbi:DUF4170 domain-containing protein [Lichenifustis flavocetrariae]|uniref:DUF4170 domain-containing protein n=1 Tax=Lichenifustis flavocetrariae TaxID=2949735 RepID=A0AA41Z0N3_9HYPH|nr:DUF4170 domain-containing protein [Lichenifustis flavocetrariae]MCW6507137.1 DUF4170 domain-containing protein [Lichenifustis flavocetrariae]